ncbi:hypothetical protein RclHR1_06820001 [Rhizophagus clarus]|uniref:Uncharacterized protein n=1 Tax=Rhizophagus clarus TaxID=94130 RepID=A0A2Z6SB61_9GLOM|nr:hypothetical protein RclHR1_06820001 [Rhizophagus clarus]
MRDIWGPDQTIGIKVREGLEVLPDEKHNRTIGIKFHLVVLPDEKHDRTIGIKCCQTKSMTGFLELRTIEVKSIWSRRLQHSQGSVITII